MMAIIVLGENTINTDNDSFKKGHSSSNVINVNKML